MKASLISITHISIRHSTRSLLVVMHLSRPRETTMIIEYLICLPRVVLLTFRSCCHSNALILHGQIISGNSKYHQKNDLKNKTN